MTTPNVFCHFISGQRWGCYSWLHLTHVTHLVHLQKITPSPPCILSKLFVSFLSYLRDKNASCEPIQWHTEINQGQHSTVQWFLFRCLSLIKCLIKQSFWCILCELFATFISFCWTKINYMHPYSNITAATLPVLSLGQWYDYLFWGVSHSLLAHFETVSKSSHLYLVSCITEFSVHSLWAFSCWEARSQAYERWSENENTSELVNVRKCQLHSTSSAYLGQD